FARLGTTRGPGGRERSPGAARAAGGDGGPGASEDRSERSERGPHGPPEFITAPGSQRPADLGLERPTLPTVVEGHVLSRVVAEIYLLRARDLLLVVEHELGPLGHPARRTRDGEQHREHRDGDAHRLVDDAGVEIDV